MAHCHRAACDSTELRLTVIICIHTRYVNCCMNMYYKPNVFQARQLLIKRSCRDPVRVEFIANIVCC